MTNRLTNTKHSKASAKVTYKSVIRARRALGTLTTQLKMFRTGKNSLITWVELSRVVRVFREPDPIQLNSTQHITNKMF